MKELIVVGGDSAYEEALYLAKLASKVYIVHRRDALRASMILQQRVVTECNIEVLWNTVVMEIRAGEDGVDSVTLQDTRSDAKRRMSIDGVSIFKGGNSMIENGNKADEELKKTGILKKLFAWIAQGAEKQALGKTACLT